MESNPNLSSNVFDKLVDQLNPEERLLLQSRLDIVSEDVAILMLNNEKKRKAVLRKLGGKESKDKVKSDVEVETKYHILVVDDDVVALRTFSNILAGEHNVSVVKSGAEALTFLAKQKPDLILLDYEMPVMDGPTTLQVIRSQDETKDIPVLFLTAVKDAEMVKRALALRPNGYILKSIKPEELKLRVTAELL